MERVVKKNFCSQNQKVFDDAKVLLLWNKYLMSALGLWPNNRNDFIFLTIFSYYSCMLSLDCVALFDTIKSMNLTKTIGAVTENLTLMQICLRLYTMRRYNKSYGKILEKFSNDFSAKNYLNEEEKRIVLFYNSRSQFLIKITVASLGMTAILYFTKPLIRQLSFINNINTTTHFTYELPYRLYLVYKVSNINTYIYTYISQIPILYTIFFTQTAMDCLTLTLVGHLCGQLGALSIKIINLNLVNTKNEFINVIKKHQELITIGLKLRSIYRICLFAQFVAATISIGILIYQVILSLASGQKTNLATFFIYGFLNIFRLFAYCWTGEYLIYESSNVANAFYQSNWYNLPIREQKTYILCIARSQKPISFMAGKFSHFSLEMFTNVMKTALAYLSFLRNFL